MKIYIDGRITEKEEAKISVYDHGLLYGDGIFEGIRIYGGRVFKFNRHLERLYDSAKAIHLEIPMGREELKKAIEKTIEADKCSEGYIRLVITRGVGALGIDPDKCDTPSVIIIVDGISLYPETLYREGISVITAATRRLPPDGLDPRVKSLNYLNNILAKIEAKQAGCMEAVMLNQHGLVCECTVDNIFIVKNETLKTPPLSDGALGGITRETVMEIASELGISFCETSLTRFDLYTADEMFLTGSGAEIIPVVQMDGRTIDDGTPGQIGKRIREHFSLISLKS